MPYNPTLHHRRSIRLKGYDYSQSGMYFITICCQDMLFRFGRVANGEMILNDFGNIAHAEWITLSERFPNVILDVFQIMPNHIHGIIVLENVGAGLAPAHDNAHDNAHENAHVPTHIPVHTHAHENANDNANDNWAGASPAPTNFQNDGAGQGAGASPAPTVGNIVGAYKSLVANQCLNICKSRNERMGKLWQRNYYEQIIRNDNAYQRIAEYIINNPANWSNDKYNNPLKP